MAWCGSPPDEGPVYQRRGMDRYREVIARMLADGTPYHCYSSPQEVDAMRDKARAAGLKPRYDGTWRPEPGKTLPPLPAQRQPVVRFKNPQAGATRRTAHIKGPHSLANTELNAQNLSHSESTPTHTIYLDNTIR